jgi:hypothetical protein
MCKLAAQLIFADIAAPFYMLQASSARLGLLCNRLYSENEKADALKDITIQVKLTYMALLQKLH